MTMVPDFHSTGIEDGDILVFHNRSDCPIGAAIKRRGTAAAGQGFYRVLCAKCQNLADGSPEPMAF